ncbi:MAG: hypothetical protein BWK78_02690 [Thiotrichaceae bacterium IS1]|nr:MAG: hypothetical protein BWK78_02690 [Thiotrichaceae bacterium IS1]
MLIKQLIFCLSITILGVTFSDTFAGSIIVDDPHPSQGTTTDPEGGGITTDPEGGGIATDPEGGGIAPDPKFKPLDFDPPEESIEDRERRFTLSPRIAVGGAYYTHRNDLHGSLRDEYLPFVEVGATASYGSFSIDIYRSASENSYNEWFNESARLIEQKEFRYRDSAVTVNFSCDEVSFDSCKRLINYPFGKKLIWSIFGGYRKTETLFKTPFFFPDEQKTATQGEIIVDTDFTVEGPFAGVGATIELSRHTILGFNFATQWGLKGTYTHHKLTVPGTGIVEQLEEIKPGDTGKEDNNYRFGVSLSSGLPIMNLKHFTYTLSGDYYGFSLTDKEDHVIKESRFGISLSLAYRFFN